MWILVSRSYLIIVCVSQTFFRRSLTTTIFSLSKLVSYLNVIWNFIYNPEHFYFIYTEETQESCSDYYTAYCYIKCKLPENFEVNRKPLVCLYNLNNRVVNTVTCAIKWCTGAEYFADYTHTPSLPSNSFKNLIPPYSSAPITSSLSAKRNNKFAVNLEVSM